MLYVANFSYTDLNEDSDNYCLMPAVVDAPDADTALERFGALLTKMHAESPLLAGAKEVYLDSLVELDAAPQEAMAVQWQKIVTGDDGLYSVLSALPDDDEDAEAYSWGDEEQLEQIELTASDFVDGVAEGEVTAEDLSEALADALSILTASEVDVLDEDDLTAAEEAFITFD